MAELDPYFTIERKTCFPLPFLPMVFCNLVIGLSLRPRLPAVAVRLNFEAAAPAHRPAGRPRAL